MIAQISDPHLAPPDPGPLARLHRAVAFVSGMDPAPDAVLLSGDVADIPTPEAYAQARDAIATLEMPVHVIAGNHDNRDLLRAAFPGLAPASGRARAAADCGALRLVACDSTVPGEPGGRLDDQELDWLDATLTAAPARPTVVAMHHPPIITGFRALDRIGLAAADRDALAGVIARHAQVKAIACGHVHRALTGALAGVPVVVAPSVNSQARLDLRPRDDLEFEPADEPLGLMVHVLAGDGVASHLQPLPPA